jgi:hypothetical protein
VNPGFLLAEDAAVKERFSGITVSDDRKQQRPVKVFFRYPDGETEKEFPFITIENIGLSHARNLQHSEQTYYYDPSADVNTVSSLNYWPSEQDRASLEANDGDGLGYLSTSSFVPVILMYQIATYTRSALHDRQLTAAIIKYVAPFRRGSIYVPEDGTVRRFDMMGWTNSDLLDQETAYRKRIFRKIYTIQMTAEVPTSELVNVQRTTSVIGTIENVNNTSINVPYATFSEEF